MHPLHWMRIAVLSLSIFGGQASNSASVTGIVEDPSGGVIAEASVAITSLDRNESFSTTTDQAGRFRFAYLPVGAYQLRIERVGFATSAASPSPSY